MAISQAATAVKNLIIAAGKSGVSNIDDVTAATVKKQLQKNGSKLLNKNGTFSAKASKEIEKLTSKLESGEKLTRLDKKTMKDMGLQYRGNRYSGNEGYKEIRKQYAKERAVQQQAQTQYTTNADAAAQGGGYTGEATETVTSGSSSIREKLAQQRADRKAKKAARKEKQEASKAERRAQRSESSDNGSGENVPKPDNPTGGTNGPDAGDVQQAMDEEIANAKNTAWYNDEAARKHLAESKEADTLRENTAWENKYKDMSEEYKRGLGAFYEEGNLKGKVNDMGKLNEYRTSFGKRLQEAQDEHKAAIDAIKDRKVGVMDWVQGHNYDKAAVGIGALGFAGSVAFGGAKSNADLYSNPF